MCNETKKKKNNNILDSLSLQEQNTNILYKYCIILSKLIRINTAELFDMVFGWLVLGLTALSDSISIYIGPSSKEREKEERKDR